VDKLAERRERHLRRSRPVRWLVVAVGFTLLLSGLVMLITPGPALAVIPIGLFLLALEFEWAERWLERSIVQADRARRRAAATSATQKALSAVAGVLALAGVVALVILVDIPVLPV
jgi:uncharacterized protein (TIGR02611 family)